MRWLPLAFLLAACGSGAYDPVTYVRLVVDLDAEHLGEARWDDAGTSIKIGAWLPPIDRLLVLEHEIWHLATRDDGHPNPPGCISTLVPERRHLLAEPCPEEIAQVNAANRVVTLSFPEDPECAREAAAFWNDACGRECVIVVE